MIYILGAYVFISELLRYDYDIVSTIILLVAGFIVARGIIKLNKMIENKSFTEKLKKLEESNWKAAQNMVGTFLAGFMLICVLYPQYFSREAVQVDNEFRAYCVESETLKSSEYEQEFLVDFSYVLPKVMKSSAQYTLSLIDETAEDYKKLDEVSGDKREELSKEMVGKWESKLESIDTISDVHTAELEQFGGCMLLGAIGFMFIMLLEFGYLYELMNNKERSL